MTKSTNPNRLKEDEREAIKKENALERRKRRNKNRGSHETADWSSADSLLIQKLIATVTIQSGSITMGYTKDGGAYYISYYFGGKSQPFYCRPSEGIDEFLQGEIVEFEA